MIRKAATNGFDIVIHYSAGAVDPDAVDFAAQRGCAVFCYAAAPNTRHWFDYRSGFFGGRILGRGPTPAMIVSGGYTTNTNASYAYGAQGEFIDAWRDWPEGDGTNYSSGVEQSFAHSATAARYAKIKDITGWTNVFDIRQALRQTCTFYSAGWREDGGYGFPLVSNRVGNAFSDATINGVALTNLQLDDLDVSPPIQPSASVDIDSMGTNFTFRWYNFRQTGFQSTVIKIDGTAVYEGEGTSFLPPSLPSANSVAEFFTKLSDGRISRNITNSSLEPYARIELNNLATNFDACAVLSSGIVTSTNFSFSVVGPLHTFWGIYESSNLVDWLLVDGVYLNSGSGYFRSEIVSRSYPTGTTHRFYRVSNDESCCSQPIGFYLMTASAGQTALLGNQLIEPENTVAALFSRRLDGSFVPDQTRLTKWNGSQFVDYTWYASTNGWSPSVAGLTFALGEGAGFNNPSSNSVTLGFVGLVPEGQLTNVISTTGSQLYSSIIPQAGGINSVLGLPPNDWDYLYRWTGSGYDQGVIYLDGYGWVDTNFDPVSEPVINVGEAFALTTASNRNWIRSFDLTCP